MVGSFVEGSRLQILVGVVPGLDVVAIATSLVDGSNRQHIGTLVGLILFGSEVIDLRLESH